MKISQFSNKYKVSNDTVRYYMDLNLITPGKRGGHYYFDEKCELQIKEILKLKEMGFSLQEIKNIFNFKRMGKLTTYQRNNYYRGIYNNKLQDIDSQISKLRDAREKLLGKINELESQDDYETVNIGIDLSALSLFSCPNCHNELVLSAEKVEENQIIEGSLNCNCGKSLPIRNGILYTSNIDNNNIEQIEDNHIEKYLKSTDPDLIDKSYQSLEWLKRQFETEELSGKVIMEPGSGYGHFLRQSYDNLPDDTIYICIDNKPQMNDYLKRLLEMNGKRTKVLFITTDLPELPLKQNVVDLLIDYAGTSCFAFENENFLPELLDGYLKKQSAFLASFIIYHKFGPNNIVAGPYRKNFKYNVIRDGLLKQGFRLEKEHKLKAQKIKKSMGKYESFAQVGDQIYSYQVKAKRWS